MASFHVNVGVGKAGAGAKHADYIQRSGSYENYKSGEDFVHRESGNMPTWAEHNPSEFFRQADLYERKNGAVYREFEFAIPNELTPEQRIEFVNDVVKKELGDRHPYIYGIHQDKSAISGEENPHAHVMYSERTLDGNDRNPEHFFKRAAAPYSHRATKAIIQPDAEAIAKGGAKKSTAFTSALKDKVANKAERVEKLTAFRQRFAALQNEHLKKAGHDVEVTHLSLKAQGIEREPEKHLGPVDSRIQENITLLRMKRSTQHEAELASNEVKKIDITTSLTEALKFKEQQHERATETQRRTERRTAPAAGVFDMPDLFRVNNIHDLNGSENVLRKDAPNNLRPHQAAPNHADLHQPQIARVAPERASVARQMVIPERAKQAMEKLGRERVEALKKESDRDASTQQEKTLVAPERARTTPQMVIPERAKQAMEKLGREFKEKYESLPEASSGQEKHGTLVASHGNKAVLHVGRGVHVVKTYPEGKSAKTEFQRSKPLTKGKGGIAD